MNWESHPLCFPHIRNANWAFCNSNAETLTNNSEESLPAKAWNHLIRSSFISLFPLPIEQSLLMDSDGSNESPAPQKKPQKGKSRTPKKAPESVLKQSPFSHSLTVFFLFDSFVVLEHWSCFLFAESPAEFFAENKNIAGFDNVSVFFPLWHLICLLLFWTLELKFSIFRFLTMVAPANNFDYTFYKTMKQPSSWVFVFLVLPAL